MSRCGSCPIYGRSEFGVNCPGDFGIEECADKLQHLYWAMKREIEAAKSKDDPTEAQPDGTPMPAQRATTLINALIDHMIDDAGGHSLEVLEVLVNLGFTKEELVEKYHFTQNDVEDCLEEAEEDSNEN